MNFLVSGWNIHITEKINFYIGNYLAGIGKMLEFGIHVLSQQIFNSQYENLFNFIRAHVDEFLSRILFSNSNGSFTKSLKYTYEKCTYRTVSRKYFHLFLHWLFCIWGTFQKIIIFNQICKRRKSLQISGNLFIDIA